MWTQMPQQQNQYGRGTSPGRGGPGDPEGRGPGSGGGNGNGNGPGSEDPSEGFSGPGGAADNPGARGGPPGPGGGGEGGQRRSRARTQASVLDQWGYSTAPGARPVGRGPGRQGPTAEQVGEHNRMNRAALFDARRELDKQQRAASGQVATVLGVMGGILGAVLTGNPFSGAAMGVGVHEKVQERAQKSAARQQPQGLTSFMGDPAPARAGGVLGALTGDLAIPGLPTGRPGPRRPDPMERGEGDQPAPSAAEPAPASEASQPAPPGLETERVIGEASAPPSKREAAPADSGALAWLQQMRADIKRAEERIVRI